MIRLSDLCTFKLPFAFQQAPEHDGAGIEKLAPTVSVLTFGVKL